MKLEMHFANWIGGLGDDVLSLFPAKKEGSSVPAVILLSTDSSSAKGESTVR